MTNTQATATHHAVLFYDEMIAGNPCYPTLLSMHRDERLEQAPRSLESLLELAIKRNVTHLWVHANYNLEIHSNPADYALDAAVWDVLPNWLYSTENATAIGDNILVSLYGRKRRQPGVPQSIDINIVFLEKSSWAWSKLAPREVVATIAELEKALGVPVSGSPSSTGYKYLRKVQAKNPKYFAPPDVNLADFPFGEAARSLVWNRIPTQEENTRRYLVSYDKNSAFSRAAVEEDMGIGSPCHVDGGDTVSYSNVIGIWKLSDVVDPPLSSNGLNTGGLHTALLPPVVFARQTWYATPTVKLMTKMGYTFTIDEGYVFPGDAPVFERWGKSLWTFRALHKDNPVLRDAFKNIMNSTVGFQRASKLSGNAVKFRPDWYCQIVAGARAAMHYNINKYADSGCYPIMACIDALYFLTDEPDPAFAVPDILKYAQSLGGYKINWMIDLTDEVRSILASPASVSRKLELLNAIAEREG